MKWKITWQATYETIVDADSLEEARTEASNIDVDVVGSKYSEDSWEVLAVEEGESS